MARGSCSSVDTRSRQLTSPSTRSDGMQSVASELGPDCLAGTRPTLFWRTTPRNPGQTPSFTGTRRCTSLLQEVLGNCVWWVLLCVATRERNRFPSVVLQPLGHL